MKYMRLEDPRITRESRTTSYFLYFGGRVVEKIKNFGYLPDGWDFGIGHAAPPAVVKRAIRLHQQGRRYGLKTDAFPGTGGEIYVVFYKSKDALEIRVNLDLSLDMTLERGIGIEYDELDYAEHLSEEAAVGYLAKFSWEIRCDSSEPYTVTSTIGDVNDSRVMFSETTWVESQSSTLNACYPQAQSCAYTLNDTIARS
jgi:hypothetical protein